MAKKKGELAKFQARKKKLNMGRLAALIIVGAVVVYFVISAIKIVNLSNERNRIEQENKELKETVEDLQQEIEIINSDEYMEGLARKKLKLVRSNEILFVLPEIRAGDEDSEDTNTFKSNTDKAAAEAEEYKRAQEEAEKKAQEEAKEAGKDSDESKDSEGSGDSGDTKDDNAGEDASKDEGGGSNG